MIQATQNEQATKIGNWIAPRLDKFEIILFLVFIISLILKISTDLPVALLLIASLMTLSTLYFFAAFASINDEYAGGMESFLHKLASWSCSIILVGALFRIQMWPSSKLFLQIGCITLIIVLPIILYTKSKKAELKFFNVRYILRLVLILGLGLFLTFASSDILVNYNIISIPASLIGQ